MTNFSIQPGQLMKQNRIWGLGSVIGERQTTIVADSDYDDLQEIQAAVRASFAENPHDESAERGR